MKLGYLMTVFPHQGHLWFWREVCWLRRWDVPLKLFSTRHPSMRDRAKHAWADQAEDETTYLWPIGPLRLLAVCIASFVRAPIGFLKCLWLGITIGVDWSQRPRPRHTWPLIFPACHLASLVRRHGITHLHTHTAARGAILCMMVQRLTGTRWSMVVNAHIEWWGGAMEQKFREAAHTFFVTQWMIEQMGRDFPSIGREKYSLGRVGVDTRRWRPDAAHRVENPVPQILSVGRLVTSKGHDVCVRAMRLLKDRGVEAKLKIGGDGPEREALETLIAELGVGDRVEMLGNLSEDTYLQEMKRADVFVLASHGEPMGVVYMEAQAMEVPAVGSNLLGAKELIEDGKTGLLVSPNNPQELAEAFVKLIRDPELRRQMGKAGRRHVVANFDSRIWAARLYEYLYHSSPPACDEPHPSIDASETGGAAAVSPAGPAVGTIS
ncbi:MAG TPA: glycosyltransferase family 4 protein [Tepidisphaeraceae bacterium]|jgi:glycosyltransferase involved in cell wall biosynthesis